MIFPRWRSAHQGIRKRSSCSFLRWHLFCAQDLRGACDSLQHEWRKRRNRLWSRSHRYSKNWSRTKKSVSSSPLRWKYAPLPSEMMNLMLYFQATSPIRAWGVMIRSRSIHVHILERTLWCARHDIAYNDISSWKEEWCMKCDHENECTTSSVHKCHSAPCVSTHPRVIRKRDKHWNWDCISSLKSTLHKSAIVNVPACASSLWSATFTRANFKAPGRLRWTNFGWIVDCWRDLSGLRTLHRRSILPPDCLRIRISSRPIQFLLHLKFDIFFSWSARNVSVQRPKKRLPTQNTFSSRIEPWWRVWIWCSATPTTSISRSFLFQVSNQRSKHMGPRSNSPLQSSYLGRSCIASPRLCFFVLRRDTPLFDEGSCHKQVTFWGWYRQPQSRYVAAHRPIWLCTHFFDAREDRTRPSRPYRICLDPGTPWRWLSVSVIACGSRRCRDVLRIKTIPPDSQLCRTVRDSAFQTTEEQDYLSWPGVTSLSSSRASRRYSARRDVHAKKRDPYVDVFFRIKTFIQSSWFWTVFTILLNFWRIWSDQRWYASVLAIFTLCREDRCHEVDFWSRAVRHTAFLLEIVACAVEWFSFEYVWLFFILKSKALTCWFQWFLNWTIVIFRCVEYVNWFMQMLNVAPHLSDCSICHDYEYILRFAWILEKEKRSVEYAYLLQILAFERFNICHQDEIYFGVPRWDRHSVWLRKNHIDWIDIFRDIKE